MFLRYLSPLQYNEGEMALKKSAQNSYECLGFVLPLLYWYGGRSLCSAKPEQIKPKHKASTNAARRNIQYVCFFLSGDIIGE